MYQALIVDDEENLVDLIEPIFTENEFYVHKAYCSESGLSILKSNDIDVIVIDMVIPHEPGRHLLNILKDFSKDKVVLAMTGYENISASEAFDNDVHAFFRKPLQPSDLVCAAKRFLRMVKVPDLRHVLSKREIEVLSHIIEGKTSKDIAKLCYISPRTVEKHRENIMKRLGVRNTAELAAAASKLLRT